MAIVVTESDCDFLRYTYNPTGKVEMRVKSILIKLASGYMELGNDIIKEIQIGDEILKPEGGFDSANPNRIELGALASTSFGAADENFTAESFKEGIKYIPVLNEDHKVPTKFLPATVILDIYPFTDQKNWVDVVNSLYAEYLASKTDETKNPPEKGDLVVLNTSKSDCVAGSYFLNKDIDEIVDELTKDGDTTPVAKKKFDEDGNLIGIEWNGDYATEENTEVIKTKYFIALAEPFGHVTAIKINGKTYSSGSGIIEDLPEFVTSLTSSGAVVIEKTVDAENGLVNYNVSAKSATTEEEGVVKYAEDETVEEDSLKAVSTKLLKTVKDGLNEKILQIISRLDAIEDQVEVFLPEISQAGLFNFEQAHDFGKDCNVTLFEVQEDGSRVEVKTKIIKKDTSVVLEMLADKAYPAGSFLLVIKNKASGINGGIPGSVTAVKVGTDVVSPDPNGIVDISSHVASKAVEDKVSEVEKTAEDNKESIDELKNASNTSTYTNDADLTPSSVVDGNNVYEITFTHNLESTNNNVSVYLKGDAVLADVTIVDENSIKVKCVVAPSLSIKAGELTIVVQK